MLIETWEQIGKWLGLSKRSILYRRKRLLNGGYVFYRKRRRKEREIACAWESSLKKYIEDQARQKKMI